LEKNLYLEPRGLDYTKLIEPDLVQCAVTFYYYPKPMLWYCTLMNQGFRITSNIIDKN